MGNIADIPARTSQTDGLAMLRMEIKAIRDRVMLDLDAALARIDAALPPVDLERYKPRSVDEYRAMYGMRPRKREWRRGR
jgi:hypothetical protein